MGDDLDGHGEVVEEAAGGPVGRVHRADEAPRVRQQRPHLRRTHLLEEGAPEIVMNWNKSATNTKAVMVQ